jgi:hypothetical protein
VPPPLDPQLRADILRDIQDTATAAPEQKLTRNEIARRRNVSPATVTKIAKDAGLTEAFDRSQTINATRARQFDAALERSVLIERMYGVAGRMLDRVESPYTQVISGPAGAEFVTTKLPPLRDAQAGMSSAAIAIDKAARLEDRQGDGRVAAAQSLLGTLFETLRQAHGDQPDGSG